MRREVCFFRLTEEKGCYNIMEYHLIHPEVRHFISEYEQAAKQKRLIRKKLGHSEMNFLNHVFGPVLNYDFRGLRAEYPFQDYSGGDRFVDFMYERGPVKVIYEIDDYQSHAGGISKSKHNDHIKRQNDLILQGWLLLRFTFDQVINEPMTCQSKVQQSIGHCWALHNRKRDMSGREQWLQQKQLMILYAQEHGSSLHVIHFAQAHHISRHTALRWVKRASEEGILVPTYPDKKTSYYTLSDIYSKAIGQK